MDSKKSTGEINVKLLWNLANTLSPSNHTNKLLRSYYLTNCKKIAQNDVNLPAVKFALSVMCPKCSSIWSENQFSISFKPRHVHSAKANKLVESLKNDSQSLSRKQKRRAKWFQKKICSVVETKCAFCQKLTSNSIIRAKKKLNKIENANTTVEVVTKKKKKKPKDKTAGLKLKNVLALQKNNQGLSKTIKKTIKKPPKAKIDKTMSKTQRQNSLIQLANMLKNRSSTISSNTNNQLEKLLK